jgi:hypothetical protein
MAYSFNDGDKAASDFAPRLPFGVSNVVITDARTGATDSGSEYIELDVENAEGISESVRVYFTDKAAKYSFQTLRQIIIHNADAANKEKARLAVESVGDSDELVAILKKKTIGGQAWVEKYYDPSRTYQGSDGNTYRSVNTNLRGYEPKLKPELLEAPKNNTVSTPFGAATEAPADASGAIPADDAWADKKAE